MRNPLLIVCNKFCRKIEKKERSRRSAKEHNEIGNVDELNSSKDHWLKSKESDKKFIDSIYEDILHLTEMANGLRVADIGCGTGVLVGKLKNDFPGSEIKGYDFSRAKIEQCQAYYGWGENVFSVHDVYDNLPDTWNVLIATEVLEHLEYPRDALDNLINALKPQGRLFVTVPNGREDSFHGHIHFWSPESWGLFLEGFESESVSIELGFLKEKNFAVLNKR